MLSFLRPASCFLRIVFPMQPMIFPPQAVALATQYKISPALALGLGEGLNLYYRRQMEQIPPHLVHVVPLAFGDKVAERLKMASDRAIAEALAGNAYGVMVCTGDWHGLDAIEKWGEELPFWQSSEGWESSVTAAADLIEQTDGLYRRAYTLFLDEASRYYNGLDAPRTLLNEIADEWLAIAARLRAGDDLERIGARVLRMAGRESRFWGMILDRFGTVEGIASRE
jgi:hypothetical protein